MTNKEVIFNSLSFDNLILAKRLPDTREIEKGHRNGPFLVIGRKDERLICLYATSNLVVEFFYQLILFHQGL